ncbi:MAG: Hsp20/alpha crystallin family protein [Candidatus Altimarinota bacterium]
MFKLFGVASEQNTSPDLEVEVLESKEEIIDEEVGQVALDVLEAEDEIYIVAPIAGVEQDQIDLSINKTILTLKGTREKTPEYSFEGITIRNSECFWGKFVRNVILPENLALNKIKAYMQNNLLVITIPKLKFDSKAIKINKMES